MRSIRAGDVTSSRRTPSLQPGILPIISEAALATTTHPPHHPLPPVPVTDLIARHPGGGRGYLSFRSSGSLVFEVSLRSVRAGSAPPGP